MSKNLFLSDSESDSELTTNNEYAKNYNTWRKKEEINKLKTKYGETNIDEFESSEESSEDDEDAVEMTSVVEKEFFKTLSCLKNKDPKIYDQNVQFFHQPLDVTRKKQTKKDQPMFLKDYERKLLLETNGKLEGSDEEDAHKDDLSPSLVEEQKRLKDNLKAALNSVDDDEDNWGGMFQVRKKSEAEKKQEEEDYKVWLSGQKDEIEDTDTKTALEPLRNYWNDPKLDRKEQFLKDYILNKRFLDKEDEDYVPTYDEIIHDSDENLSEDENAVEKQEEFEHKYNFRFEEPDQEFIKRYPRTMENSLRRTDDRRKEKRAEVKERKIKEKAVKFEEISKLKELKMKEIEEKIKQLKEITGETEMDILAEDIDGDFDPEAYDKRMKALFNDDYYEGAEEDQKPKFDGIDDLEVENWDNWEGKDDEDNDLSQNKPTEPHCEDENFVMDCDYDPQTANRAELIENSRGKKKRKRKSKFSKVIAQEKPIFDPSNKTYQEYLDEYYKLDCEDIIDDVKCRFKYREVAPNSFGLTIEEIMSAKDRELNKWCSLKKAVQIRSDEVERYDQIAYKRRGSNVDLKKKFLPSLFSNDEEKEWSESGKTSTESNKQDENDQSATKTEGNHNESVKNKKGKIKKMNDNPNVSQGEKNKTENSGFTENKKQDFDRSKKKLKKKKNDSSSEKVQSTETEIKKKVSDQHRKGNKRKRLDTDNKESNKFNKKWKKNNERRDEVDVGISNARLSAFGINPKKFKNKMKYGNKNL